MHLPPELHPFFRGVMYIHSTPSLDPASMPLLDDAAVVVVVAVVDDDDDAVVDDFESLLPPLDVPEPEEGPFPPAPPPLPP